MSRNLSPKFARTTRNESQGLLETGRKMIGVRGGVCKKGVADFFLEGGNRTKQSKKNLVSNFEWPVG